MTLVETPALLHGRPALVSQRLRWLRVGPPPSAGSLRRRRRRAGPACSASPVQHEQAEAACAPAAAAAAAPAVVPPEPVQRQQQQPTPQPPVAVCRVVTLSAQPSLAAAVQQLHGVVRGLTAQYGSYASGLVRLEVPVPRGCVPLWWLRGQGGAGAAAGLLYPRIYFSPRRSTAADTEGSAAARAASRGCGATAGAGAAWLWQGRPGEPLGEAAMRDMQRFLSAASPRVRAFGGARFDAAQQPAAEWAEFGSYCFLIPRLEYVEASGCNVLACTVAWDAACDPASSNGGGGAAAPAAVSFFSIEAAVMDALAALEAVQPPAPPGAGAFQLLRCGAAHAPDSDGWAALMEGTHAELNAAAARAAEARAAARALSDPEAAPEAEGHGEAWLLRGDEVEVAGDDINACTPLLKLSPEMAREEYLLNGQEGLDDLLAALDGGFEAFTPPSQEEGLTKVVLARRTDVTIRGQLDPLALLEALQERDPRAYQVLLQLPSGASFLGSTPECLYTRTGRAVASEAVAGTRARGAGGDVEKDFWLAFDLLRSHKDHEEFTVVRDWVRQALSGVCSQVQVDVAKSVLKQGAVQHLYGKLSGQLEPGMTDADVLRALHPTPAVCGRPREEALERLASTELFDRGYYAGPFGWVSQDAAEFVVAIRSALVHPAAAPAGALWQEQQAQQAQRLASHAEAGPGPGSAPVQVQRWQPAAASTGATAVAAPGAAEGPGLEGASRRVSLYAGVGIVRGSDTHSEWSELDLKMRQFERLLQTTPALAEAPNINSLWAGLMVEELCRLGCNTFCVAPGSRSSPLTVAIAQHPRARVVLCIDERSLGFWALGYGRATGRPAVVVTSSGTAVANLLPSVVEAAQSCVPMLLLTADRPAELRDTGANQTTDQVKMFGGYARWHADLPAPSDAIPARSLLSSLDHAARAASAAARPGPVHLNCQFREPLAPVAGSWSRACLQGLERWEASGQPYTTHSALQPSPTLPPQLSGAAASAAAAAAAAGLGPGGVGTAAAAQLAGLGPEAAAALGAVLGAQRGLLVIGELTSPEDVVAAAQLARLLRWPVAADILSGLRAGVQEPDSSLALVNHFDHVLLGGQERWAALRPDCVLQLGGHLTSKRLCQFLEWCALPVAASGSDAAGQHAQHAQQGSTPSSSWVFVDRHSQRHDQSWLLTHRVEAPLPLFAAALAAAQPQGPAPGSASSLLGNRQGGGGATTTTTTTSSSSSSQLAYTVLLQELDREVGQAVDAALDEMWDLTEPHVARLLARELPPGEGLFVGNSMPIRDLDMYAVPPAPSDAAAAPRPQGVLPSGVGAPVAANRGASGIDGVLSTAAGFADGLGRGTTLVVGDLSFLHDINGLNLLRSGEMRPPLTVVLINNGGGGIFSFLPIADAVPEDVFTPLWATPQHVDLAGMCRAQGIPHIKVNTADALRTALRSAWGLNRHSVVEVVTDRGSNVDRHRTIQAAAQRAAARALPLLQRWQGLWQRGGGGTAAAAASGSAVPGAEEGGAADELPPFSLRIESASYAPNNLPLARPLTTPAGSASERATFVLHVAVRCPPGASYATGTAPAHPAPGSNGCAALQQSLNGSGSHSVGSSDEEGPAAGGSTLVWGAGEVAPLPGLSSESAQQAERQLAMLCTLLRGAAVPLTLPLLGGRFARWLEECLGVGATALHPSVRAALEAAVLSALAQCLQVPLADLLGSAGTARTAQPACVAVNGLLDSQGTPQDAASAALKLVHQGHTALKLKVGRREDPLSDARAVLAVRQAVGPGVVLRADCNRGWTLEQAVEFGRAAAPAGLQYLEEPVRSVHDVAEFHRLTGIPVALDESVDEGLVGPGIDNGQDWAAAGVEALVLKPSILGGIERTLGLARWARSRGMRAVVSSAFETPLGLALWAELATAIDAEGCGSDSSSSEHSSGSGTSSSNNNQCGGAASITHHGLGTLDWFDGELQPSLSAPSEAGRQPDPASISLPAARLVVRQHAQRGSSTDPCSSAAAGLERGTCAVSVGSTSYCFGLLRTPAAAADASGVGASPAGSAGTADPAGTAPTTLFLHGFLGSSEDWAPFMAALAAGGSGRSCLALDLPGHGSTRVGAGSAERLWDSVVDEAYSLEAAATGVAALVQQLQLGRCAVVGYSLGGRLALLLAARWPHVFTQVAVISGTPGIPGAEQRAERAARDEALALALRQAGTQAFLKDWYQQPLWGPLRRSPRFRHMLGQRQAGDARELSTALASMSPGRAPSLWAELRGQQLQGAGTAGSGQGLLRLLLVVGEEDGKFVELGRKLCEAVNGTTEAGEDEAAGGSSSCCARAELRVVPGCGHAVHVERPLELLSVLDAFLPKDG